MPIDEIEFEGMKTALSRLTRKTAALVKIAKEGDCANPDKPDYSKGCKLLEKATTTTRQGGKRKSRNKRKKRKTRKRKGGLPECGMVENPDEWCKQQAAAAEIEDNEKTMCNRDTGKCVKPTAVPRNFQSRQGRRTYQRLQSRRQARQQGTIGGRKKRKKRKTRKKRSRRR
tara:strand:+ start:198 stop:710 length:513 start_codon:yes stop_codon:yes gene_type:complete